MALQKRLSARQVASVALLSLALVLTPLQSPAQEKDCECDSRKRFYLAVNLVPGGEAEKTCREGFHMASLWEILDPSNLKYATEHGVHILDQGSGPPSGTWGWVHTGWTTTAGTSAGSSVPGKAHCFLWNDSTKSHYGTRVRLNNDWTKNFRSRSIEPWQADARKCNNKEHVWCMED